MSLRLKILLLAGLNLLLIALAGLGFLLTQRRADSLLLAPVRDKVVSLARLTARELSELSWPAQDAYLYRLSQELGVSIVLYANEGRRLAGANLEPTGEVLALLQAGPPLRNDLPPPPRRGPPGGENVMFLVHSGKSYWLGVRVPAASLTEPQALRATLFFVSSSFYGNRFFFDPWPWVLASLVILAITLACWIPFIRNLTNALSALNAATNQIARGDYAVQAPRGRRDEIGQLSASVESLSQQLHRFVEGQKRFLGDVAHELCSPLARVQVALGIFENESSPAQKQQLEDLHEEVQHMSKLVDEILAFTKAGLRKDAASLAAVNILNVTQRALARESHPAVPVHLRIPEQLQAQANPDLLQRVVANLLRNAIRYAGDRGPIVVSAGSTDSTIEILVEDNGPGMHGGSSGLGLEIVKNCMNVMQGSVSAANREGGGCTVRLTLPAVPLT